MRLITKASMACSTHPVAALDPGEAAGEKAGGEQHGDEVVHAATIPPRPIPA
jgi:hypothetical protein